MEHEDGFCDRCGCDMRGFAAQLVIDGALVCITCATDGAPAARQATKKEARDDGR